MNFLRTYTSPMYYMQVCIYSIHITFNTKHIHKHRIIRRKFLLNQFLPFYKFTYTIHTSYFQFQPEKSPPFHIILLKSFIFFKAIEYMNTVIDFGLETFHDGRIFLLLLLGFFVVMVPSGVIPYDHLYRYIQSRAVMITKRFNYLFNNTFQKL